MQHEKKIKVVMLATDNKSNITKEENKLILGGSNIYPKTFYSQPQYLYFLSDEEIKEGDWYYCRFGDSIYQLQKDEFISEGHKNAKTYEKIIATTNPELTKDIRMLCKKCKGSGGPIGGYCKSCEKTGIGIIKEQLPIPPDSFIQKFVEEYNNGNIIEEVLVEYYLESFTSNIFMSDFKDFKYKLKVAPDNTITIRKIEKKCKCCGKIL